MIRNVHPVPRISDPGVNKAPDPGSGSATLVLNFPHLCPSLETLPYLQPVVKPYHIFSPEAFHICCPAFENPPYGILFCSPKPSRLSFLHSKSYLRMCEKPYIFKHLAKSKNLIFCSELRIGDVYPGSRIPDLDFYPSRIPDPGSKNSNKRER
jgi:hypothetical protein